MLRRCLPFLTAFSALAATASADWPQLYQIETSASYQGAADAVVDRAGNLYILGNVAGPGADSDIVTLKYDKTGKLLWALRWAVPMVVMMP